MSVMVSISEATESHEFVERSPEIHTAFPCCVMQSFPDKHPKEPDDIPTLTLLLLRLLEHLLDDLLLLNQECTNDTVPNTVGTS
jgi:hypothetical protein